MTRHWRVWHLGEIFYQHRNVNYCRQRAGTKQINITKIMMGFLKILLKCARKSLIAKIRN